MHVWGVRELLVVLVVINIRIAPSIIHLQHKEDELLNHDVL